jgi:serine/threonine-protein kinase RsbW
MKLRFQDKITLNSALEELSKVETYIDQLLEKELIPAEVYGNVMVATTEAILNAINHGNQNDPEKTLEFYAEFDDKTLIIKVVDQGKGFDHSALLDPTTAENVENLSGRGIFIIHNLADQVTFENNGSTIILEFSLNINELVGA